MRRRGLTLEEIKRALSQLPEARSPSQRDWERLSKTRPGSLDGRISELRPRRDKLSGCISCGCLSLDRCGRFNPDDRAANNGAGARFLLGDTPEP